EKSQTCCRLRKKHAVLPTGPRPRYQPTPRLPSMTSLTSPARHRRACGNPVHPSLVDYSRWSLVLGRWPKSRIGGRGLKDESIGRRPMQARSLWILVGECPTTKDHRPKTND